MFNNLKNDGLEQSEDRLGGFAPWTSNIYDMEIKLAYAGKSDGGALNVSLVLVQGQREYRETIYVSNKKGENFYKTQGTGDKKLPLPGFTLIDDLCLIAAGKGLAEMEPEEKSVKLYDFEAKKELPKAVQCLTELHGQKVSVAIIQRLENKTAKNERTNEYDPTPEEVNRNGIEKVFNTEHKMTVAEARDGAEATFWDKWLERNKDKVQDKRTYKGGAVAGGPPVSGRSSGGGKPAPTAAAEPARKSLFAKKS